MFLPANDNPQYNRLMGRLRYRLGTTPIVTGSMLWLVVIILASVYILNLLLLNDSQFVFLYCCCGSGTLTVFSVMFGINSARFVAYDCKRPSNELVVMSLLSNQTIVNGYWRSIFGQLLARNLFPLVALPFIYGFLNLGALLILSGKEPAGTQGTLTSAMVTLGQMGFYWFLTMFGIMLALILRRSFWAIATTLVLSIILLSSWVIANLVIIGNASASMNSRGLFFYMLALSIVNFMPYLSLIIAWRIAIFSARYPFFQAWRNYQDRLRASRYNR